MDHIERECHGCGKFFSYNQLEKKYKREWGKQVYYCSNCAEEKLHKRNKLYVSQAIDPELIDEEQGFHVNWWDK
jgi:hypothetical protein